MHFLQNTWYMAGWADELGPEGAFVHRTIADQPILIYRRTDGSPAALADRCPHRFVPLHMGKQIGDTVQCGYHGLRFGPDGVCSHHPVAGATIPQKARVRSYPVVERHAGLWVWLGAAEAADAALIPDFAFLDDPARARVSGHMLTRANYQLAIDNLSDLTHVQFVHGEFQATEAFPQLKCEVEQQGNTVTVKLTFPGGRPPPFFRNAVADPEAPIDLVFEVRWDAPSCIRLTGRAFAAGDRQRPLFSAQSAHIVTPETAGTCHYFFANSRDYAVGDKAADERVREWQRIGFGEQDKPMLEAQQRYLGAADIMAMQPVLLGTDVGAVRIRRVLKALIEAEISAAAA